MNKNYNILICPLEWGLGHAARMIPMARKLKEMNHNVLIASGEGHLSLFRTELPGLVYIPFPGFKPVYSSSLPQYIPLLLKTPLLLFHIIREHFRLKRIIVEYSVDIVISDNRFGLWNRKIKTVYVTHMPLIPFPKPVKFLEFIGILLHRAVIRKYSFCFIPDLPGELNVSGRLSHGIKLPGTVRFIGILSRFTPKVLSSSNDQVSFQQNTIILSGPEPQKEILKQKIMSLLKDKKIMTVILEGRPGQENEVVKSDNTTSYSHLISSEMQEMITQSKTIITRAGYSTIMELVSLNCTALLIPTPGQTEQEYLAEYLSAKKWFTACPQGEINEGLQLPSNEAVWPGEILEQSSILLNEALKELLE